MTLVSGLGIIHARRPFAPDVRLSVAPCPTAKPPEDKHPAWGISLRGELNYIGMAAGALRMIARRNGAFLSARREGTSLNQRESGPEAPAIQICE
jgi:hypothetical protein